jgi:hypothetical protein
MGGVLMKFKYFLLLMFGINLSLHTGGIKSLAASGDAVVEKISTVDEDKSVDVEVSTSKGSSFRVVLPKTVSINPNTGIGTYDIKVSGDIDPDRVITIKCNETVTLSSEAGDQSLEFDVSKTKTKWYWNDIKNSNVDTITEEINLKEGQVIPAGQFIGNLTFYINCAYDVEEGVFTAEDAEELGYDIATARSITIPSEINYSNGKVKKIRSVEGSLFKDSTVLESVTIEEGVLGVGPNAFENCTSLSSIQLPNSLTDIEDNAFKGTTSLAIPLEIGPNLDKIENNAFEDSAITRITFNDSVGAKRITFDSYAFKNCVNLETVTMPETREVVLGGSSFYGCTKLKTIEGEDNIIICANAFSNCTGLEEVTLDFSNPLSTTAGVFQRCNSLTTVNLTGVKKIEKYAFTECPELTTVVINEGITSIENDAFRDCHKLTSLPIQSTLTEIGESAFENCYVASGSYTIPAGVTVISKSAFEKCYAIDSLRFEGVITEVGEAAFKNCGGNTLTFKDGLVTIGYDAFAYSSSFPGTKITEINLPDTVTTIGDSAFKRSAFTTFKVPKGVTVLSAEMIANSKDLESITLHENVRAFGKQTFYETGLKSIEIPNKVVAIPVNCFGYCTSLSSVITHKDLLLYDTGAFKGCSSLSEIRVNNSATINGDVFSSNTNVIRE